MLEWLFKKKDDKVLKDLIKVLKDGITIKVIISGNINEKERRNSLDEAQRIIENKIKQDSEGARTAEIIEAIPDISNLKVPEVNFGEEKEA